MSTTTRLGLVTTLSALVAAALGSSATSAARTLLALPPHLWGVGHVNEMLVLLLGSAGTAGALWHALSGVLALVSLAAGARRRGVGSAARLLSRWGAPYVRRVAAGALATALVLPSTAIAQEAPLPPDDLGWVPTVSATTEPGPSAAPTAVPTAAPAAGTVPETPPDAPAPETPPDAPAPETPPTYVVQDGDSLWTITSSLLHRATPSEVAAAWPELYRANDGVIGQDPDLIHPGTVLTLPTPLTDRT